MPMRGKHWIRALGALLARRPLVSLDSARDAITAIVSAKRPQILAADLAALQAGYEAAARAVVVTTVTGIGLAT